MKHLILLLTLMLSLGQSYAQELTQTIKGRVVSAQTLQPIEGATVVVMDLQPVRGAYTDSTGSYRIENVPVGRRAIEVRMAGFESFNSNSLILNSSKELTIDAKLNERFLETALIFPDPNPNKPLAPGSYTGFSFSAEEAQRFVGAVNDPSRMAQNVSGVQAPQDNNSDIVIRGNSPIGLLWRLEGVDIPNPNHFARKGSSGGGISVFSAQLIGNSDFSAGAFAAEYGNAFSGVFDMKFRRGDKDQHKRRFKFGLLGTDLALEGPIKNGQSSYLVNYRYSTLGILNDLGFRLVGERIDNNFQDLSFNIFLPSKDLRTTITLFGIGGLSEELWDPVADSLNWSRPYRTTRDYLTRMGATGITYTRLLDDKSFIKAVVAVSGNQVIDNDDTLDIREVLLHPDPDTLEYVQDWTGLGEARYKTEDYQTSRISSHVSYNRQFGKLDRNSLKVGVLATHMRFNFFHEERVANSDGFETIVKGEGATNLLQGYVRTLVKLNKRLEMNAGLHSMFLTLNNTYSLEPRLSFNLQVDSSRRFVFAYGLHGKVLPLGSYFTEVISTDGSITQPNLDLEMIKAHHLVLAYEKIFDNNLRFNLEGYYQHLFDVPVTPNANPTDYFILNERDGYADRALVSEGTGRNIGLDLTLQKFFRGGLYYMLTGSIYQSTYTASDGNTYSTRYDSRYNTNLMGGKEWTLKKGGVFQLGGRVVLNGGLKYTPGDEALSQKAGKFVALQGAAYTENLGTYFRIDSRIAYRKDLKKSAYIISLDVQNVTNRFNPRDQIYDPGYNRLQIREQSGLTPVLAFQIDF
ncbi:MAG: TonB-dependent receptor [Bacteroidota bacterium]